MEDSEHGHFADDSTEYYAVLNLPRDASDEDVRRAYRSLAQVCHPDKHTDPDQKKRAEEAFNRLQVREAQPMCRHMVHRITRAIRALLAPMPTQEAYEVLSDQHRRQVYDVYGKEGLAAGERTQLS